LERRRGKNMSYDIVDRLQRILDTAEARELDGTEQRTIRDAIRIINELRRLIKLYEED
jgi:hypothetical protein